MSLRELADVQEKDRQARWAVATYGPGCPEYEASREYLDRRFGLDPDVAPKIGPVAQAVQQAAEVHGVYLDPQQAADIALAALQHNDGQESATHWVSAYLWDHTVDCREEVRRLLQRSLSARVLAKGLVPVGLPVQSAQRNAAMETVEVTLSVAVRRPL